MSYRSHHDDGDNETNEKDGQEQPEQPGTLREEPVGQMKAKEHRRAAEPRQLIQDSEAVEHVVRVTALEKPSPAER